MEGIILLTYFLYFVFFVNGRYLSTHGGGRSWRWVYMLEATRFDYSSPEIIGD